MVRLCCEGRDLLIRAPLRAGEIDHTMAKFLDIEKASRADYTRISTEKNLQILTPTGLITIIKCLCY